MTILDGIRSLIRCDPLVPPNFTHIIPLWYAYPLFISTQIIDEYLWETHQLALKDGSSNYYSTRPPAKLKGHRKLIETLPMKSELVIVRLRTGYQHPFEKRCKHQNRVSHCGCSPKRSSRAHESLNWGTTNSPTKLMNTHARSKGENRVLLFFDVPTKVLEVGLVTRLSLNWSTRSSRMEP